MKRNLLLTVFWLLSFGCLYGQIFTSVQDGNWHDGATWGNTSPGTEGVDFPGAGNDAVVFHNVTVTSPSQATVSGVFVGAGTTLTINVGARLYFSGLLEIEDDGLGGNGFLVVNGTLRANQGSSTLNDGIFSVSISGLYEHNFTTTAGNLILADWLNNSECRIIGYTTNSAAPGNLGQTFHHFTWNCPNFVGGGGTTTFISLGGALTSVNGNLTVSNTGGASRTLRLFDTSSSNTLTVGGNLIVNGSGRLVVSSTGTSNVVNVTGNFSIANTATAIHTIASTGSATVNVTGAFSTSVSGGTVSLNMNSTGTPGTGIMNIGGNFTNGASCTIARSGSGGGSAQINFNGSSVQSYSNSGSFSGAINFTIQNGSTVDLGTSAISGSGSFTLLAGGTMRVGSPDGLVTGSTLGNIRNTGARTYQANGNIVYSGTTQNLGNEWSSTGALNGIAVNLEVINGSAVTNNNIGSTSLVGVLTLTNGRLNIGGSNSLTIQGVFNSTGSGFIGGSSTSNLTFSGSGAMGTLNMASGATSLNNLTVSRTGTLVLGSSLTVEGTIDLSFGNLNFSGRTLTMNGGSIVTAGTGLISNSASNLIFGGSTFSGTVPFQGAGNQLNDLTFSTPGGAFTWNSPVTINNNVTLTAGTITHNSGLTMGTGSTFIRSGGSLTTNDPDVVTSYNVTYTGSVTTGLELPGTATELNTLTINSSGSVTLDKDITVNGNVNLQGSALVAGTRNITLAGATGNWNRTSGSFSGGTGVVTVAGNYTIVAPGVTPSFTNITVNSTRTLTLPTGNINIGGNLVNNGTIAPSTSTAIFNGTTTISGSSTTSLNNVTVSGTLTAPSATTLNIAGNWTNNGTFNNNNGAVNFNGTTTIAGSNQSNFFTVTVSGTLTAPTSSLGIAGNFTNSGTFNNNGGTVVFNGTVVAQTVSGSATTFNNVTVSNPVTPGVQIANTSRLNGTLTLTSGAFMDADGPSGTGVFIVSSTSQTVGGRIAALPNPTNLTGQVTIERYIHGKTGGDYRYLSMPITTNANLSIWRNSIHVTGNFSDRSTNADNSNIVDSGNTNPSVFTYNSTTQAFTAVNGTGGLTSATSISSRIGYSAYDFNNGAVTVSYRGVPERGNVPITISNTNGNFNLVPNPYPSPLDWDNVVKTNVNDAMYLRVDNNVFSSYVGGVATNAPFGGWTGEISTGQAFWVVSNGGGTTFTMREADKTGNNNYFLRTKSPDDYFRISLNTESGRSDEIVIRFADNASDGYDPEWDAFKLKNDQLKNPTSIETTPSFNLSSYVNNPMEEYAINSVAKLLAEKIINLNIADVEPGEYVLKFSDLALLTSGYRVVLVDLYGRKETDITDGSEYAFQITETEQSAGMGRFYLRINGEPAKDFPPHLTELQVYPNPTTDYVYIELSEVERANLKSITLLNGMGANLSQENYDQSNRPSGKQVVDLRERPAGLYLIAVQLGEQKKVIRVLKR
jgi:hypothetical protein